MAVTEVTLGGRSGTSLEQGQVSGWTVEDCGTGVQDWDKAGAGLGP